MTTRMPQQVPEDVTYLREKSPAKRTIRACSEKLTPACAQSKAPKMDEGNGSVPNWRTWTLGSFLVCIGCFAVVFAIASVRHYGRAFRCAPPDRGLPTVDPDHGGGPIAQREPDHPSLAAAIGEPHGHDDKAAGELRFAIRSCFLR